MGLVPGLNGGGVAYRVEVPRGRCCVNSSRGSLGETLTSLVCPRVQSGESQRLRKGIWKKRLLENCELHTKVGGYALRYKAWRIWGQKTGG